MLAVKKAALGAVVALGLGFAPVVAKAETLAQTLIDAYRHSGLLDQNRAVLRAADEDVATAMAALRPVISWSADVTRTLSKAYVANSWTDTVGNTTAQAGLNLNWTVFDFGSSQYSIDAAKETVLATRQALLDIEQQVLLRAVAAYMGVRSAQESVALRQANLRLLNTELRAARDRFEVGEVTRTDVAQAEAQLALSQANLAAAQGDLATAVAEFRAAVGRGPGGLAPAQGPRITKTASQAVDIAVRTHPLMKQVQHQVTASELAVLAVEAGTKPSVSITGTLGASDGTSSNFGTSASVGAGVRGTLYSGGARASAVRQSIARRDQARAGLHLQRHAVMQNVENAYATLQAARAQITALNEQARAANVAFQGVREEAKLGARTTLDVLDAEQTLLDARTSLIAARNNEIVAAYSVLSAIGQLTVEDLKLGIPTYDPAAYYNMVKDAPSMNSKQGKQLDRVLKALGKE